jgi:hypothetical protein
MLSLADLALDETIKSFESAPCHPDERLNKELAAAFFSRLSTSNINPSVGGEYIDNDEYWRHVCRDSGKSMGRSSDEHCFSYKQMYFENLIQEVATSDFASTNALLERIRPYSDYIHSLRIGDLQHGFPVDVLCTNLPNLSRLELQFNRKCIQPESIKFQGLRHTIASAPFLTCLTLKNSHINDDDVAYIFSGAQYNLIHLDLSHNQISSMGLGVIVDTFITPSSILSSLSLSGNKICYQGAVKLGAALGSNDSLMSLSLRLNNIQDNGGLELFDGVAQNKGLVHINVSANKLGSQSARAIIQAVNSNERIESVLLTSNLFSHEAMQSLSLYKTCVIGSHIELAPDGIGCLASEVPCSKS